MDPELLRRLEEQNQLLQNIYRSTEKTRKYFQASLILTIFFFVVPLIVTAVLLPKYLASFNLSQFGL